jgi:phosphatidylglycerol:prolipoprotein diacylglycerol transferase
VYPELFSLGPVTVYTYGVLLAVSYLLGLYVARRRAGRMELDNARVLDLGIYIIIAALVGAKLLLLIVDFNTLSRSPADLLSLAQSAGVFYGGLVLAIAVGFWFMLRHALPMWTTCDAFAPGIALGHVTGRVGCLAAGCCYGTATTVPWAVTFTSPLAAANVGTPLGVHLHPTQLYEAGAELAIFALLLVGERRGHGFAGRTFWSYLLLYALSRFVIEFFRGDPRGTVFDTLSTSQVVSLILAPVSIAMLILLSRRPGSTTTHGIDG